jgi:excisionase family DNA binding protein
MKKTDQPEKEHLVSIGEAANRWGISPLTVRYWIRRRKIVSHKLGGRRLVPISEVERLIKASRQPAKQEMFV